MIQQLLLSDSSATEIVQFITRHTIWPQPCFTRSGVESYGPWASAIDTFELARNSFLNLCSKWPVNSILCCLQIF